MICYNLDYVYRKIFIKLQSDFRSPMNTVTIFLQEKFNWMQVAVFFAEPLIFNIKHFVTNFFLLVCLGGTEILLRYPLQVLQMLLRCLRHLFLPSFLLSVIKALCTARTFSAVVPREDPRGC